MRSSEWVSFVYFAALTAIAWMRPLPTGRRITITVIGVGLCAAIPALARNGTLAARDWVPAIVILIGYYVSGRFFFRPSVAFEHWLMAWDRRLLGDPATRFANWPRSVLGCLEIVYMGCFLLVPGGFAILAFTGHASLANRYWTIVTAAEFGAFAGLAFIQTRPPWVIERKPVLTVPSIHWLASQMVQNLTTRANTFPSGHAAGSLAVGLAVVGAVPWAGAVLLLIAAGICLGSVIGRYHYVMDVVAGTALALAVWLAY
jgi:membrane-associated phospholipid phosphatase